MKEFTENLDRDDPGASPGRLRLYPGSIKVEVIGRKKGPVSPFLQHMHANYDDVKKTATYIHQHNTTTDDKVLMRPQQPFHDLEIKVLKRQRGPVSTLLQAIAKAAREGKSIPSLIQSMS